MQEKQENVLKYFDNDYGFLKCKILVKKFTN